MEEDMSVFAAVMTGKGTGAISTIGLYGDSAEAILQRIFEPAGTKPAQFKTGRILLGTINDGSETIDQVTIGCEGQDNFAINCHGNPLIVEMIMQLLAQNGATLITAEQLLAKTLSAQKSANTIAIEAKIAQLKARTIHGTKIITNQIEAGLNEKIAEWKQNINIMSLDEIKADTEKILKNSQPAKLIIYGCTVAIIGPPNTGKSTLLNHLAGRQKAIVTDIKGTTRDWVSAQCQIGSLSVELIDTAGLDEKLAETCEETIEKISQQRSIAILEKADVVLLVLDNSQSENYLDERLLEKIVSKPVLSEAEGKILTVLNKCDLPERFDMSKLSENLKDTVLISAKFGTGIENLCGKIQQITGVNNFDLKSTVCITCRQENLLKQLQNAKSKQQMRSLITELLNGQLRV